MIKRGTPRADIHTSAYVARGPPVRRSCVSSENVIRVKCPNLSCQRVLAVPVHARGKIVRCSRCGTNIRIPPDKDSGQAKAVA